MFPGEMWGSRMLSQPDPIEFNHSPAHRSSASSGVGKHPAAGEVPSQPRPEETTGTSGQAGEGKGKEG